MKKIEFISLNADGEQRTWSMTPEELLNEWHGEADLPDLSDTIVSCVFDGTVLYFETFSELMYVFTGEG